MNKLRLGLVAAVIAVVVMALTAYNFSSAATHYDSQTFEGSTLFEHVTNFFRRGIQIGQQTTGGVTRFNGSMVNATTTNGVDNPLTFADDVRIDGAIFRTEQGGSHSLKFADSVIPTKDDAYSLGTSSLKFKHGFFSGTVMADAISVSHFSGSGVILNDSLADGSVTTTKIADGAVTGAKIADGTITGSDVSTSASLAVGSLTTSGSGAVKGWALVDSSGNTVRGYNVVSSARTAAGRYTVKFNFDVSARAFLAVPSGAAGADITAVRLIGVNIKSGTTDTVMVNTYDDFGSAPYSYADSYFVVGVY